MTIESLLAEPTHADNLFAGRRFIYDALRTPGAS